MAFDDLDLEFEDEDEAKKKKSDAVPVDVDLEFHTPEGGTRSRIVASRPAEQVPGQKPTAPNGGQVKNINEARVAQAGVKRVPPQMPQAAQSRVAGSNALKEDHYELEGQEVIALREQMKKVAFDSEVKVAVAEFKTEYLSEMMSDMKLMEHQINQMLVRINAKHPDMKQEALMIKKLLADFTAKKRK
jgi:hypothetical protein